MMRPLLCVHIAIYSLCTLSAAAHHTGLNAGKTAGCTAAARAVQLQVPILVSSGTCFHCWYANPVLYPPIASAPSAMFCDCRDGL
ncbi:hypothetical protein C8T65DRAFT_660078, partial [Cerioporus squamosus]